MSQVFLASAGTQAGPITDRPTADLTTMCLEAAQEALQRQPLAVDAIYLGTMAVHRGRDPHAVDVSHIPTLVRQRLAPTARGLHVLTSTSESGAQVFAQAVRDLREGRYRRVLVLAGEQMFTPGGDREADAQANATFIRGVVDPSERGAYGLTMLQIGDLLMDHIVATAGPTHEVWRDLLAHVAIDKARRAQRWPRSFAAGKGRILDAEAYADEARNPQITRWYRRQDVVANACGATAVLLTTQRQDLPPGPHLAVLGLGHGDVEVALRDRTGPRGAPGAIAQALAAVTQDAQLTPLQLRTLPGVTALLHDAFPAIELLFLHALAQDQGWPWALQAYRDGWAHPLGGLAACGHALGNSGLLQIAQAFALVHGDRRLLLPDAQDIPPPRVVLTSSVGSALTRVVMTILADLRACERLVHKVSRPRLRAVRLPKLSEFISGSSWLTVKMHRAKNPESVDSQALSQPAPFAAGPSLTQVRVVPEPDLPLPGTVLACTRPLPGTEGFVHAVQQPQARIALALYPQALQVGTMVTLSDATDPVRILTIG